MSEGVASEVQDATTATGESADAAAANEVQESIQAGYDRIANPDKPEQPTVETPPEPVLTGEQARELLAQVARIPDLEKQLRDTGGRYGALKQTIEQLQQRMATSTTASETAASAADASELLTDLREEFPELADKLQGAFSRVMASKGGIDPEGIEKAVAARLEADRKAATEEAMERLSEAHPDWQQVRETSEFKEWKESLTPRVLARFTRSQDPDYVAEMLDQHKDWLKSRTPPEPPRQDTAQAKRLTNAVLPTNGTRQAPKGEPDPKASIRIGYERIAGRRI